MTHLCIEAVVNVAEMLVQHLNHVIALVNVVCQVHFIILKLGPGMHVSWKGMADFSRVSAPASYLCLNVLYVGEHLWVWEVGG